MNLFFCMYENVVYKNFNRERENIFYIFIGFIFSASIYRKYKFIR